MLPRGEPTAGSRQWGLAADHCHTVGERPLPSEESFHRLPLRAPHLPIKFNSKIKIVQHNVLAWTPTRSLELTNHYLTLRADVILLNSHGRKNDEPIRIFGYTVYQRNSRQQGGDGVAIAVKSDLAHVVIDDFREEVMAIRLDTQLGPVVVATAYLPPRRAYVPYPDLLRFSRMRMPVYLIGDFNGRHRLFNYRRDFNTVGEGLARLVDQGRFQHLGPDFDTYFGYMGTGRPDAVLSNRWTHHNHLVEPGPLTSSDHIPIVLTVSCSPIAVPAPRRRVYARADWAGYTAELEQSTQTLVLDGQSTDAIEPALDAWYASIDDAKSHHIPMADVRYLPHPRQSHRLRVLQVMYREVREEAQRTWTREIYHRQKVLQFELLKESRRLSNEKWGCLMVALMGKVRTPREWYREVRRLRGSKRVTPYILDANRTRHYQENERGDLLHEYWSDIWGRPPEDNPEFDRRHEDALRQESGDAINRLNHLPRIDFDSLGRGDDPLMRELSAPVTVEEVTQVIKSVPDKTPGYRQVCKADLVHLPRKAVENLTTIFNGCLAAGYWPKQWKTASVIFIPKSQDPHLVEKQRPISLLEIPGKLLERLICQRLTDLLEDRNILHPHQYGFRRRRGTQRALALIWERCASVYAQRQQCNLIFRDVERAFDRVWHFGLKHKLLQLGMPNRVTRLLFSFLDGRTARVKVGNYLGDNIELRCGVPQGSVLSPVLYILYTADTPVPRLPSKISSYADDNIQLSIEHNPSKNLLARRTERDYAQLNRFESQNKINTNLGKTKLLPVARYAPAPVNTDDGVLPVAREVRALGLRLNRCGFYPQIDHNRGKAIGVLRTLYRFRDIPARYKLQLYKTVVRPLLEYPAVPLHLASRAKMLRLQAVQNRAIMWITGHRFREEGRPSIRRLHKSLKLEPLNQRLHKLAIRTWEALAADEDPNYEEVDELANQPSRRRANADPRRSWWPSSLRVVRQPMPRPIYSGQD